MPRWMRNIRRVPRSLTWSVLSLVSFSIAGGLTWKITHVRNVIATFAPSGTLWTDPRARYAFALFGTSVMKDHAAVTFDYALDDAEAVFIFRLVPGAKRLVIAHLMRGGCHYIERHMSSAEMAAAKPLPEMEQSDYTVVDVSALNFDRDHSIDCDVDAGYLRESFTTTVVLFQNFPVNLGRAAGDIPLVPMPVELRLRNITGTPEVIAASNSEDVTGEGILLEPSDHVAVRWRWIEDEQRRDIFLVLIGIFTAFGVAMLIEVSRPFVEEMDEN